MDDARVDDDDGREARRPKRRVSEQHKSHKPGPGRGRRSLLTIDVMRRIEGEPA